MTSVTSVRNSIEQTGRVVRFASRRRDATIVFVVTGIAYLAIYLYAIGNLAYQPGIGQNIILVDDPLTRMFDPGPGSFSYEPIAVIDAWSVRYLLSPINTLIGAFLGVLVGINLGLSYLAIIQPKACGIGAGSGILASVPAVLAGSACCAPVLLIVLGITASGTVLSLITWLLPIGIVLLVASLIYLARQINPGASGV